MTCLPQAEGKILPPSISRFSGSSGATIRAGFMSETRTLSPWRIELRETLRLAWPLALANLLQMLVHAVDVIFVARLGERELAASALGIALFGLLMWAFSGLTGIVAALIAEELGRKRHAVRQVRRSVRMGLWLAVASGVVGMAICWQGEALMLLSGQSAELSARAGDFLRIIMWAMIPMVLASVLRNFVSALGRPIFATAITGLALGASLLFNWMFVFGNLGAPALGLEGSALASVLTSVFVLTSYVVAIGADRRLRRYRVFGNWWRPEWSRLREIVTLGSPVMIIIIAEAGLFSGAALLMGRIGESELAGHTVALQIAALAFQVPFSEQASTASYKRASSPSFLQAHIQLAESETLFKPSLSGAKTMLDKASPIAFRLPAFGSIKAEIGE
mgnify:CR=1 FL=1